MNSKIIAYLNFAVKSNSIVYGIDNIVSYKKKMYCIMIKSSLGNDTSKRIENYARENNICQVNIDDDLASIPKLAGVKIFAITDENLATAIIKEIK